MDYRLSFEHPAWPVLTGLLMVVATFLLAVATWQLVKAAKAQTHFLEKQIKPEVKLGFATSFPGLDRRPRFAGFTLTNIGVPDVTLIGAWIALPIPAVSTETGPNYLGLQWRQRDRGRQISNFNPPHRLKSGDGIYVRYDLW